MVIDQGDGRGQLVGCNGPHWNSAQAMALTARVASSMIHGRSARSSGVPWMSARIRKLVSRWIIRSRATAADLLRRAPPPRPVPTG